MSREIYQPKNWHINDQRITDNISNDDLNRIEQKISDIDNEIINAIGEEETLLDKINSVKDILEVSFGSIPDWQSGKEYLIGNQVKYNSIYYCCIEDHTSGDSLSLSKWRKLSFVDSGDTLALLDNYEINNKMVKISCIGKAHQMNEIAEVGTVLYNIEDHTLRIRIGEGAFVSGFKDIPYLNGAIYSCKGSLYVWNGSELVPAEENRELCYDTPNFIYNFKFINSDGSISTSSNEYASITETIELNSGDMLQVVGYASTITAVISATDYAQTFYKPILFGTGEHYSVYTYYAKTHEKVCVSIFSNSENLFVRNRKKPIVIPVNLVAEMPGKISENGILQSGVAQNFSVSKPFEVMPGDIVDFTGHVGPYPVIIGSFDKFNTYQGTSFRPYVISPEANSQAHFTYLCKEKGNIVICARTVAPTTVWSAKIIRNVDSQREYENYLFNSNLNSLKLKNNYVDQYDFVPNLMKKRINSTLCYKGDDKQENNHIVNAVAYPDGVIIAARSGGKVVRIDNDGNEEVLLDIPNAEDWRGVYIDSNLNVFVSPHSGTFSTTMDNINRGLYRLKYGENSFSKVISLCRSKTIIKVWKENTLYNIGDIIFHDGDAIFYTCKTSHTSTTEFNTNYWDEITAEWTSGTNYQVGDILKYKKLYYYCATAHTSGSSFNVNYWNAATEYMDNDDTIWTMCEDDKGYLYAGVYAHSKRANPSVYRSMNGGITWQYQHNFINSGTLKIEKYGEHMRHVHCINFNNYDNCLYAAIGEVNTLVKSNDQGAHWVDLDLPFFYGQPTYVLGVKDGLVIGSDGHYSCGMTKVSTDQRTIKSCGRVAPGFIFAIRRSDITGWLYAFTRIDFLTAQLEEYPPLEALTSQEALNDWLNSTATTAAKNLWQHYNNWASIYYPEDAIRPSHAFVLISRDEGETWEVLYQEQVSNNYANINGFICTGYFRDGECLTSVLKSKEGTAGDKEFSNPLIISEGKKKRILNGYDLDGEIFIKTNKTTIIPCLDEADSRIQSLKNPPEKISIMQYNCGAFNMGKAISDGVILTSDNFQEKIDNYKKMFCKYSPDVIGIQEFVETLNISGLSEIQNMNELIFNPLYPYNDDFIWNAPEIGAKGRTIKSKFELINIRHGAISKNNFNYTTNCLYSLADFNYKGRLIAFLSTAIIPTDGTASSVSSRELLLPLLFNLIKDYDYAFLTCDLNNNGNGNNVSPIDEGNNLCQIAENNGFKAVHGSYYPWTNTYFNYDLNNPNNSKSKQLPLDNIFYKNNGKTLLCGVDILDQEYENLFSDHVPIIGNFMLY